MSTRSKYLELDRRHFLGVALAAGFQLVHRPLHAESEPIAVVVGPKSSQRTLSLDKLRRIFLAKPTADDDDNLFLPINVTQPTALRERFDRCVLDMSPDDVASYWIDQRIRGKKPPRAAATVEMARRAVSELGGAISYLPLSLVGSLRILLIDGKAPTDPQYRVR